MGIAWLVFAGQYVSLDKPLIFRHHMGLCLMQGGATSHIEQAHGFGPFASSCLGNPNRLTLIQLSVTGMSSVGWLGDGDLPM